MRRRIPDRYVRCDEKSILKPAKPVLLKESEGLLPLRIFPGLLKSCCSPSIYDRPVSSERSFTKVS